MVICFLCPQETKRQLDELLANGSYSDCSSAIVAAVHNLHVLEAEVAAKGAIVMGKHAAETAGSHPAASSSAQEAMQSTDTAPSPSRGSTGSRNFANTPVLFQRPEHIERPTVLAAMPTDVFFPGQPVPLDRWVFGQFSKLLPAKASCRALARMASENGSGLELHRTAARIAKEASTLARILLQRDLRAGAGRDDAWALGFPSAEENADKSRLRFANQFVGSISKQGTLTGLLIDLKFINLAKQGGKKILLTPHGWDFAVLHNPVLDGDGTADLKFSADEIDFLFQHITERVPVEDFAFRTILQAICDGNDTPDKLAEVCRTYMPPERGSALSDAFVTTQRTGVISRLADLSLITRRRDGVRVSYVATESGQRYCGRHAAA